MKGKNRITQYVHFFQYIAIFKVRKFENSVKKVQHFNFDSKRWIYATFKKKTKKSIQSGENVNWIKLLSLRLTA